MYLFLGQDTVVRARDVVGIFDLDNTSVSKETRGYLAAAEKSGRVFTVSEELPKSFVVCEAAGKKSDYISQVAPATLLKRANSKTERIENRE
jgi:predicted Zn-dependent protease